jgi:hypothetical protein
MFFQNNRSILCQGTEHCINQESTPFWGTEQTCIQHVLRDILQNTHMIRHDIDQATHNGFVAYVFNVQMHVYIYMVRACVCVCTRASVCVCVCVCVSVRDLVKKHM